MFAALLIASALALPRFAASDTVSEVYRAVLRDLGSQYDPRSLVLTSGVRECHGALCDRMAPQGYSGDFLVETRDEELIGDYCTYVSGECIKNRSKRATELSDVQVMLSSPMSCGSECFEVTSWAIVVENQSLRDVRTLYRIELSSGKWGVTRRAEQGKGFIG